ncbi:MAG TPA: dioxygenase [Acidimicrobiia bacterium]|jgi:carotenoid cleavage dioxygenase|nr:dioxygenase [Acidimicrobiia bacterium]HIL04481.1 dioxygenase [Acidimicrobiia bacterium]
MESITMTITDGAPFHLRGNFAPVFDEVTSDNLEVRGSIPPELNGRYLRNGANPITGESAHWFLGDGMVHGVRLRDGQAEWYRNRWVRTPFYDNPTKPVIDLENLDFSSENSKANTHVVRHAGRILCLEEGHLPWEISEELETIGPHSFGGQLDGPFTAHPKICPTTGEMLAFGYGFLPPAYLTFLRVSATGELVQQKNIEIPAPVMMHDFNITASRVVFMDLPVVFDFDVAVAGGMPFSFQRDNGARLGVMDRGDSDADVQWLDIDPCYVFHPINSYDDDGQVIIDVARYPTMWETGSTEFDTKANLWRWEIDTVAGRVTETQLDDRPIEFGRVADSRVGLKNRFGYAVGSKRDAADPEAGTLVKYDFDTGDSFTWDLGKGRDPGEFVFVPRPGSTNEDGGWLMGYVYDRSENRSSLLILNAEDPTSEPLAEIVLPQRVPFGFHGSWIGM